MICWSCEKDARDEALCAACGAPQPVSTHGTRADHFAVLGVERRYDLEAGALEARYKELSRKLHPDRFAKADPRARRAALQRTVALNEAWRALKDPLKRAEYLLELGGVKIATDDGGARSGGVAASPALLMEILELREELGDARAANDDAKVARLGAAMRARADAAKARVAAGLTGAPTSAELEGVARELVALRYYQRFLDEVTAHEDVVDGAAAHG
ncbi:MAG TPA: Fe-S protein assembly co-chaperone HscB [Polyangia bacterium]|jgi:molecular chaperone HscB|nr:Fe-S protein assembly co-chaperone HscB [Polyangia bacterium]